MLVQEFLRRTDKLEFELGANALTDDIWSRGLPADASAGPLQQALEALEVARQEAENWMDDVHYWQEKYKRSEAAPNS